MCESVQTRMVKRRLILSLTGRENRRLIVRDANCVLEETVACSAGLATELVFSQCEGSSDVNAC